VVETIPTGLQKVLKENEKKRKRNEEKMNCPYCDASDQVDMTVCTQCKRFIVAPKKSSCLTCSIILIVAIGLIALYIIMR